MPATTGLSVSILFKQYFYVLLLYDGGCSEGIFPPLSQVASDVSGSLSAFSGSVLTSNGLSNGAPSLSTNGPSAPSTGRSVPLQTTTTTTTGE